MSNNGGGISAKCRRQRRKWRESNGIIIGVIMAKIISSALKQLAMSAWRMKISGENAIAKRRKTWRWRKSKRNGIISSRMA